MSPSKALSLAPKNPKDQAYPDVHEVLQSENIFRHLVESVRDYAIFLLTPEGNVASWNPGAERHQAISRRTRSSASIPASSIREKILPMASLKWNCEKLPRSGRFEDEGWRIRKDGTRFWANVVITAVRDEDGTLVGFGKITRDLTERREAELRYRSSSKASATMPSILSIRTESDQLELGRAAHQGLHRKEIIGKHFHCSIPRRTRSRDAAKSAGNCLPDRTLRGRRLAGAQRRQRFWSSVVVTPFRDEAGELIGFSKITQGCDGPAKFAGKDSATCR